MLHLDIGRRETGKTTLAIFLARRTPQRLIFDPRDGIQAGPGAIKVDRVVDLSDVAMPMLIEREASEVIFTPRGNDLDQAFFVWARHVKRWVADMPERPIAIVIDECALVNTSLDKPNHPIQAALRWCPRDRIHFYLTAHRPSDIPTRVRAIGDYWILFHCNQEHDLKVLEQRCGEFVARRVERLKPYDFVIWDDARGLLRPSVLPAASWYIDLSAAPATINTVQTAEVVGASPIDPGALWK